MNSKKGQIMLDPLFLFIIIVLIILGLFFFMNM
jgi:uncharacterized protein (UPF0333 family)